MTDDDARIMGSLVAELSKFRSRDKGGVMPTDEQIRIVKGLCSLDQANDAVWVAMGALMAHDGKAQIGHALDLMAVVARTLALFSPKANMSGGDILRALAKQLDTEDGDARALVDKLRALLKPASAPEPAGSN